MYVCPKCGNHTRGKIEQIVIENDCGIHGMVNSYEDWIVCRECGFMLGTPPQLPYQQAYLEYLQYLEYLMAE